MIIKTLDLLLDANMNIVTSCYFHYNRINLPIKITSFYVQLYTGIVEIKLHPTLYLDLQKEKKEKRYHLKGRGKLTNTELSEQFIRDPCER